MKMNQAWKKQGINIRPGTVITGKWHRKRYVIKRRLGQGAVGTVYLCEQNGRYAALKISENAASMTVEVNVLKSLQKVQGNRLGPSLLDVDDWEASTNAKYAFMLWNTWTESRCNLLSNTKARSGRVFLCCSCLMTWSICIRPAGYLVISSRKI